MKRIGAKNKPAYRIVVADSRSPRDGKFIEELGTYQPLKKGDNVSMDYERAKYWLSKGAQPTDTVASFIRKAARTAAAAAYTTGRLMQTFLEYVVKGLVDRPDAVTVTPVQRAGATVYELRLHPTDMGKIIGKQGATIHAIRSLLQVGSARAGQRCSLEIIEERPET